MILCDISPGPTPEQIATQAKAPIVQTSAHQGSAAKVRTTSMAIGSYAFFNAAGEYLGRTAVPSNESGKDKASLKANATRMAYSEEMLVALASIASDFDTTGIVSDDTMTLVYSLLAEMGIV